MIREEPVQVINDQIYETNSSSHSLLPFHPCTGHACLDTFIQLTAVPCVIDLTVKPSLFVVLVDEIIQVFKI